MNPAQPSPTPHPARRAPGLSPARKLRRRLSQPTPSAYPAKGRPSSVVTNVGETARSIQTTPATRLEVAQARRGVDGSTSTTLVTTGYKWEVEGGKSRPTFHHPRSTLILLHQIGRSHS